jgi:ribose-phosphate pyrophosphokinase
VRVGDKLCPRHPREDKSLSEIAVFGGSAHPDLAAEISAHLEVALLPTRLQRFANDCLEVQLRANCRERDVFLIQPLVPPVQEHLVELLLMLDAARGASAARITAVMPHYAYARSDKKDAPRISIGGRLVADLLVTAGANRVLTMTLHSPQVTASSASRSTTCTPCASWRSISGATT